MTSPSRDLIEVVGIGADGWDGLSPAARQVVIDATVVFGSARQIALLPPIAGQRRITWPSPMLPALDGLLAQHAGEARAVLASGDPLLSGLGTTLITLLGPDAVRVHPAVSSVALALAELRWSWEETEVITLVGRPVERVIRFVSPGARLLVLSSDHDTARIVSGLLTGLGYGASRLAVLGDLGTDHQSRHETTAQTYDPVYRAPALSIVAVECATDLPALGASTVPGLAEDAFDSDGQLTKRDVRASALSRLAPRPGELLWDLGAGTGTIAIEWSRHHPANRAHAVERDPARAERIATNAQHLGVPDLVVHQKTADECIDGLPDPDAVFIGGGATAELIDRCLARVKPGGRLVLHAVTLQTEAVLTEAFTRHGGELTRISVEHLEPIGQLHGWRPSRAITQWSVIR